VDAPGRVDLWAGTVHVRVYLDHDKVCPLMAVGVREDGANELVASLAGRDPQGEHVPGKMCSTCASGHARHGVTGRDRCARVWKAVHDMFPLHARPAPLWRKTGNVLKLLIVVDVPSAKAQLAMLGNTDD
jgi:hypothetical protein